MDYSNHFPYIQEAKINKTATKGRFMFLDRHGKTALSTDDGASDKPLGVYYYDNEITSTITRGWVQYYGYNWSLPIYLELASAVAFNQVIDSTADGRGKPASLSGDQQVGYARATETGLAGEIIHVLVQYTNKPITHAFSSGFDLQQFE